MKNIESIMYKNNSFTNIFQFYPRILLQCQILGVAPIIIRKNNMQYSFIQSLISFILALLILISTFFVTDVVFLQNEKSIFNATNLLLLISENTYAASVWICASLQSKELIMIFHNFIEFDYKLCYFRKPNDLKQEKSVWNQQTIQNFVTVFQILMFVVAAKLYFNDQINLEFLRTVYLLLKAAVCLLTSLIVNMVYIRFLYINKQLFQILKSKTTVNRLTLYKICELHHCLSKIIKLFNKTFGVSLLFTFCTCFITIVVVIFYITANLKSSETEWLKVILLVLLGVPFIVDVAYICHICYRTIIEVRE